MLEFYTPRIGDREWIQPMFSASGQMASENAFGTLFIWGDMYRNRICRYNDTLFASFGVESNTYYFPVGSRDLAGDLSILLADSRKKGLAFRMWGITERQMEQMEKAMPATFAYKLDRASSDYIYNTDDLINLSGRRFNKKRNHLNKFVRNYRYSYEELTPENLADCIAITREWLSLSTEGDEGRKHFASEGCALRKALDSYAALKLSGGLIKIDEKSVAFTIGEEIDSDVFLVHFEKALPDYDGLYAAINQEFAANRLVEYRYVNREEDMGIEGLRKAKLSYNPVIILDKYSVVLKGD